MADKATEQWIKEFRDTNLPREVDRKILNQLLKRESFGATSLLGFYFLLWVGVGIYMFWDDFSFPFLLFPFGICLLGVVVMLSPVIVKMRCLALLRKGRILDARIIKLDTPKKTFPKDFCQVEMTLEALDGDINHQFKYKIEPAQYSEVLSLFERKKIVHLLVDPEYERSFRHHLWWNRYIVVDWLRIFSDSQIGSEQDKTKTKRWRLCYPMGFAVLVFSFVGSYLMSWGELNGVIATRGNLPDSVQYLLVAPWLIMGLGILIFLVWAKNKRYDWLSRLYGCGAIIALSITLLGGIHYLNIHLDESLGKPATINITDFFSFTAHRRDSTPKSAFTSYFIGLDAPTELPNYDLLMVYNTDFEEKRFLPGNNLKLMRHKGFFGHPWYQLETRFSYYPRRSIKRKQQKFKLIGAQGYFAPNSPYRQELMKYGLEVKDLTSQKEREGEF